MARRGQPFQFDNERVTAGDTERRLQISDRHDELDAIAHGINVIVDELAWTTRRALEAQEERALAAERENASKNIFVRNVSHEIRTPITAMLGFAALLALPDVPEDERPELLRRLQANGQAVLSLLSDLLDLSKLDAQKVVLTPEEVVNLIANAVKFTDAGSIITSSEARSCCCAARPAPAARFV